MNMFIEAKEVKKGDVIVSRGYGRNIRVLDFKLKKADNRITFDNIVTIVYDEELKPIYYNFDDVIEVFREEV